MVAVASTLGVVIPPSLVLILLGDAMLGAHTIAVTATGRNDRVINTQDVFHGALVPAGLFLVLCLASRGSSGASLPAATGAPDDKPSRAQVLLAIVAVAFLLVLLGGVALRLLLRGRGGRDGRVRAVRRRPRHRAPARRRRCARC